MDGITPKGGSKGASEVNTLEPLLRMGGSQLQSIYDLKTRELNRLQSKRSSTVKTKEQIAFIEHLSMTKEEKGKFSSSLPSTDRGKMRFPKSSFPYWLDNTPTLENTPTPLFCQKFLQKAFLSRLYAHLDNLLSMLCRQSTCNFCL